MKSLTASLPEYFPSVIFFLKMIQADIFVIADNLQFSKHSPVNRTRIKTPQNWQWLTIPVLSSKKGNQIINSVNILTESNWQRKHEIALKSNYKYAPFFEHYAHKFEHIFHSEWKSILDLNLSIIDILKKQLRLKKETTLISKFNIRKSGTERIIELAKALNCDTYLIFDFETAYVDTNLLMNAGIAVKLINTKLKHYRQQFDTFTPNLSVIDLLFNMGNESMEYLYS